jgi:Tfp pilus assembly protein PilF
MICPMLLALKPTDDNGNAVDRECIYENCRFFNIELRDCNLMVASRSMLKMAEQGPQVAAPGLPPTALADMERRFNEVGRGLLHSSIEVQDIVRQAGLATSGKVAEVGDSLAQRLEGLAAGLQAGPRESEAKLAASLQEIEGRLGTAQQEFERRIASALQESEARTAAGLQGYLAEMRASFDEGIARVQTRLDEQGRGVGATAAAASQSLEQLAAITDLQQKIAERLLEEMSLLSANAGKLESVLASLDKKLDKASDEGLQISQQLLLVKGQSEKTHAALRGLHEGNRAVITAVETQLQRDQSDLARKQQEEAESCNNRGVALYYRGAMDAALAAFRRAVELIPAYAEAHNNLGLVLSKMGQEKEATEAFQEALRIDPAMAEVYNNLGFMYHTTGKFDRAVQMFGQAIQNSADSSIAYTNLGNSFYKMKQAEKAVEAWRRALELDPMNENARRSLRMFQQDPGNN